jgi:hypothetical protein
MRDRESRKAPGHKYAIIMEGQRKEMAQKEDE